ncbi:AraC family transcriptional regulator [Parendozoicomonas haliclonae]|uniref:HTH-type transcriptional regulator VirS n=1 Tax=Parendozoicomonas haliclonae TaxID=1960125 RepID=A0A1X7AFD6_9GAMM|nr:AraC family transcriptional regulator [Parendozoicomonas haliclonae]SMA35552.1 HTH-type transcriptional regulator VirS [Parendozoicomonas haliclonae]
MKYLCIASTWINALLLEFDSCGLDTEQLTQGLPGFQEGQFSQSDRLDLLSARILWHRAAKLSNEPLLGARIGIGNNYRSFGVLAPLIWHSDTLRVALQNVAQYQTLISENGAFRYELRENPDRIIFTYEETPLALSSSPQQVLSVTIASVRLFRMMSPGSMAIKNIFVPSDFSVSELQKLMGIRVETRGIHFGFEVTLDRDSLNQPIPGCDSTLYLMSLEYANQLLAEKEAGSDLIQQVRRYVLSHGLARAEIAGCAESCGTYPRKLQRQLEGYGTSFRKIKEDVLKERTIAAMHQSCEIKEIADLLGYTELSGFYRVFKSWFGVTPKKAMKQGIISTGSPALYGLSEELPL